MFVYRIEDNNGIGCYVSPNVPYRDGIAMNFHHQHDPLRPSVVVDVLGFTTQHKCGFASLYDLQQWFDGWLDALAENDFGIALYSVQKGLVLHGLYQVAFPKRVTRLRWERIK